MMQGKEYLNQFKGRAFNGAGGLFRDDEIRPYGCILQDQLVPARMNKTYHRYLNSGLILGHSRYFRSVANATVVLLQSIPTGCIDDQVLQRYINCRNILISSLTFLYSGYSFLGDGSKNGTNRT
jgi:hypothetical protein